MKLSTFLLVFTLLGTAVLTGQNTIFSEDFANGIPADWSNVEVLGNGQPSSVWVYSTEGPQGAFATAPIESTTADNGWVLFDSDLNCNDPAGQDAWLISPAIDGSGLSDVWLRFETFYRSFNDRPQIRVGTDLEDLASWGTIEVFPGIGANDFIDLNPDQLLFNLSEFAAGESEFYFAFQFLSTSETANGGSLTGCGYAWQVDDVEVLDFDPRPDNDMRVNTFFALPPNRVTPASQVTPFGFIADIENLGAQPQSDATLRVSISGASGEVFSDQLVYSMVGTDSVAENVFFEEEFVPDMMPGAYTGQYELTLSGDDANPDNNIQDFSFIISDTLFQRDSGEGFGGTRPADDNDFSYGNVYYVTNGDNLFARHVTFGISDINSAAGFAVSTLLYEWTGDLNGDGLAAGDELTGPIAFNSYAVDGTEESDFVTIPVDIDGNFPALQDDTYYIIVVQFAPDDDDSDLFLSTTSNIDYSATEFYQDSVGNKALPYVALDVGNVGEFSLIGFGLDNIPAVRLSIGSATNNTVAQLPENSLEIMPSPANTQFQAIVNLETPAQEVTATLFSANGQVMETRNLSNIQQTTLDYNVSNLPAGNYYLRLQTEQGIRTLPVAVQH